MPPTSVGWAESRGAVASMASRITQLIRSIPDPSVPALGVWNAGGLAAHIAHLDEVDRDLLTQGTSPLADLATSAR